VADADTDERDDELEDDEQPLGPLDTAEAGVIPANVASIAGIPADTSVTGMPAYSTPDTLAPKAPPAPAGKSITGMPAASAQPAASLTGMPAMAANPPDSLVAPDTAAKGPTATAQSSPLEPRPAQENLEALEKAGPAISRKHGIGGGILKALETAGTIVSPGAMQAIPGTRMNYAMRTRQAANAASQEAGNIKDVDQEQNQESLIHARDTNARNVGKTIKAGTKTMMWNPATQNYDMDVSDTPPAYKSPQEGYTAAVQNAMARGADPSKDPAVQHWADAITSVQREPNQPAPKPTEEEQFTQKYLKDNGLEDSAQNQLKARTAFTRAGREPKDTSLQENARTQHSYEYANGQLEKVRTPIDGIAQRLGNLQESLKQGTPQADALVAPELLSIMAGGAGSGLRMNEAEISRIVGGRSKWEDLKAAAQKWSLDPKSANSITKDQRTSIHALTDAVAQKISSKREIIEDAEQKLIDTDDPKEHKQIVVNARRQLDQIDNPGSKQTQGRGGASGNKKGPDVGTVEGGYRFTGGDPSDKKNWVKQ
jgi:hypothetical protein